MKNKTGYIKIHRKMLDWEWYHDKNVFLVFIHLLLKANYKDCKFEGVLIKRGQVVTGRLELAMSTTLTERQVRTALTKLKSTNEISIKSTNRYSIITIENYNLYQDIEEKNDQQNDQQKVNPMSSKRPASDQQATTSKEIKKERNKKDNNNSSPLPHFNLKTPPPPTIKREQRDDLKSVSTILKTGVLKNFKIGEWEVKDIINSLDEKSLETAKKNAPGWDIYELANRYIGWINEGRRPAPNSIKAAFPAWCLKYTKGKRP